METRLRGSDETHPGPAPSPLPAEPVAMKEEDSAPAPAELSPCPFCGGGARLERHPAFADIVRVACDGDGCGIRPATEYLLEEFRAGVVEAWNRRGGRLQ